jgi:DNA polymerase III subunit delta'
MAWQGIIGHDDVVERFRARLTRNRLASTFLFVGPRGIGKRTFALKLAQSLLCQVRPADRLDPCGACPSCQQVVARTHPDLHLVAKPAEKSFIPVELFIGPTEKRMQEGLCHDMALKPFMGGRRVAVIDDADYFNEAGANCLLKTLEEPPPRSVMILVGTSAERQLPTIRSRAQIERFRPLARAIIADLLLAQGVVTDRAEAARLADYSDGSLEQAAELADPRLWAFRGQLLKRLAEPLPDTVGLAKVVGPFVDEAGKEAAARRARARLVIRFAVEFYRHVVRGLCGAPPPDDPEFRAAVATAISGGRWDEISAAASVDRCLEAITHVDRNANQAALLECWLDDLARIAISGRPTVSI